MKFDQKNRTFVKKLIPLGVFFLFIFITNCDIFKSFKQNIYLADPTIFKDDCIYYLYGTTAGGVDSTNNGIKVYLSNDLVKWEYKGYALKKGNAFGDKGFWAPQIFKRDNLYYMFYTANEKIGIAFSGSPLGPFKEKNRNYFKAKHRQIDPFVFFDNNKFYLYHVKKVINDNEIFVAELKKGLREINEETLTKCLSSECPWENEDNIDFKNVQGPSVFKIDSTYYMLYSANNFKSSNYAVGYATSSSPLGPWNKSKKNPLISFSNINQSGPGHGDVFFNETKNYIKYVLHTHNSIDKLRPRKTGILDLIIDNESKTISLKNESFKFFKVNKK